MIGLFLLREQHGSLFASIFSEDRKIPWRPLTIEEFLDVQVRFMHGAYPHAVIEDEIFRKCVLNQVYIDNMEKLPAGTVSAVAQAILAHSGPSHLQDIQQRLDFCRREVSSIVHDMASLITQGFPAYTLEQVYSMDYETFMLRVAQAERKLLQAGILRQPISFTENGQPIPSEAQNLPPPEELERLWRQQNPSSSPPPPAQKQTVITEQDRHEHMAARAGHDAVDAVILEKQTMDDVPAIYKEYVEQMKRGEKVKIMTQEERIAAAEERARRDKEQFKLILQEERQKIAKLEEKVAKIKPKKSRRRRRRTQTK